jgi:site-specific DNA recombinase
MESPKRAAIYCRVSSTGQKDNSSLRTQKAGCRAFCAERGYQLVDVFSDVYTGALYRERPALTALRQRVRAGEIDVVVAYALDRLSRNQAHLAILVEEVEDRGASVAFVTEDFEDSAVGRFIRSAKGFAAEIEREKIVERTERGKRDRVDKGRPHAGPRPPYGYSWVHENDRATGKEVRCVRLVENPATAPIVRRIFREVAAGSSARQVAIRLSTEGIPTPTGLATWQNASAIKIIRNPVYVGAPAAYRYRREEVRGHKVVRGGVEVDGKGWRYSRQSAAATKVLAGVAPALVPPELAAEAIARLAANKQESTRNNPNPEAALLRGGYARCGYCGNALNADNGQAGTSYRCNTTQRDRHGCPHFSIQAHTLDDAVWPGVRARLLDRALIAAELERLRRDDPTRADADAIAHRSREAGRKQRNLMDRLAQTDDADVATLIMADLAVLTAQRRRWDAERDDLDRQRQAWQDAQQRLADLDLWVRNVAANLDDIEADYGKKRFALAACKVQVRVWASDHDPRWHATMHLGDGAPIEIADTTSRCCSPPRPGTSRRTAPDHARRRAACALPGTARDFSAATGRGGRRGRPAPRSARSRSGNRTP